MNRKSFAISAFSLLAATAFTSCSADADMESSLAPAAPDRHAITFRVDNASLAPTSSRAISTNVTDFKVSAIDHGNPYFPAPLNVFSSDNGSSWTTSLKTYWPAGSLTFVAYVDHSHDGSSFSIDGGNAYFTGYEVPADIRDQSDLMYAVASDVTKDSSKDGVSLNFRHALAQITFSAQNSNPAYSDIEILSVELGGVKGSGTYSFPKASTSSEVIGEWTVDTESADRSYKISDLSVSLGSCRSSLQGEKVIVTSTTRSGDNNAMFLIPQTVEEGAYIKVTARLTLKDVPGSDYTEEQIMPLSIDWQEGQRYNYHIDWNTTPIAFDVKVADFNEVSISADL